MNGFLLTLLSLSLTGSLLGALLLVLRPLARDLVPKAFCYYAWLAVLLRLLLPVGYGISLVPAAQAAPEAGAQQAVFSPQPVQTVETEVPSGGGAAAGPVLTSPEPEPARAFSLPAVGFCLWLAGAAAFLLWHVAAYASFSHRVRSSLVPPPPEEQALFRGLPAGKRVRLAYSGRIYTPMLLGLFRPVVVLPRTTGSSLKPEELKAVLCHELTHYRRGDILYKWLVVLTTAVHWFNPLVHWMGRRIALDCELSCDEAVLSALPAEQRRGYGEVLLSLSARRGLPAPVTATTLCEEKRQLKARIRGIVHYRRPARAALCLSLVLGLLLACCACGRLDLQGEAPASSTPDGSSEAPASASPTPAGPEVTGFQQALPAASGYGDILLGIAPLLWYSGDGSSQPDSLSVPEAAALFGPGDPNVQASEFTVLDLDGDGEREVVVRVIAPAGDMGGYLILRQQAGGICGFPAGSLTLMDLKEDGSFTYSSSAGTEDGVAFLRFGETGYTLDKIIRCQGEHFEYDTFLMGEDPISQEEYLAAASSQEQKPDAVWYALNEANVRRFF